MSRHSSIDALRERYQRSRIQPQQQNDDLLDSESKQSSLNSPVATVYEEEEEEEEEDEDEEGAEEDEELYIEDDDYSMYSSSSSIPDENINFDLVYALHTFVATVDGQASVVKGDAMTLLDDSNSYWWLIRALKASEVGYIPAENIETPFERLARLNKHRNVQVTSLDQLQHYKNTAPPKRSHERKTVKVSRDLACQVQIILTDQDDESLYEETFEKWQEEMSADSYKGVLTVQDEDDESDSDDSDERVKSPKSSKKKENKKKFTPLLNPDFNKSIHTVADDSPSLETNKTLIIPPATCASSSPPTPPPHTPPHVHEKPLPPTIITEAEKPISAAIPDEQPTTPSGVVTGLKRLLSIGKKNKPVTPEVSLSNSDFVKDTQYHVLRIFAGNINVGALFNSVAVTPDMNADQLLKLALQKFHIPLLDNHSNRSNDGIEYYLTVKSMDSDEITLTPQDKPLAIFESLNDHLTTPMPSLTYIKRLSMEQPTIKVTRVGVSKARQRAKARFGEDSVIRFSLHKRIKRTIETSGQIYVKISYYAENKKHHHHLAQSENKNKISTMGLIRKSSLLRVDQQVQQQQQQQRESMQYKAKQERIDKLVAVSVATPISDLKMIALEKFHLINEDASLYYISLSVNDNETPLNLSATISDALGDPDLIPKLFVLRKRTSTNYAAVAQTTSTSDAPESMNNRRFMRFLKSDKDTVPNSSSSSSIDSVQSKESSTGTVLRRLDQAIQSLENDKRQLVDNTANAQQQHIRIPPARSNSLSAMSSYNKRSNNNNSNIPKTKIAPAATPTQEFSIDTRRLPTRSSSLKISTDAFDNPHKQSLSNMDDLQLELSRIASSHQNYPLQPARGV